MYKMEDIARKVNDKQSGYKIGELPNIRKKINNMDKVNKKIFSKRNIKNDYAFHYGGRKEIQFNIGYDKDVFRCGLAFSLQRGQSLHNPVAEIAPKIRRFNLLVESNPSKIKEYKIWDYSNGEKTYLPSNSPIPEKHFTKNNFIFIGKELDIDKMDLDELSDEILTIFDDLLPIYIEVESDDEQTRDAIVLDDANIGRQKMKKSSSQQPYSLILYGPPGTGKTYSLKKRAVDILEGRSDLSEFETQVSKSEMDNISRKYSDYLKENRIMFTTFHQSMSYETFIEGLTATTDDKGNISYEVKSGIFRTICEKAVEHPEKNYVLIIDEINRGNVSSVFGELITLIEPDKRKDADNEISLTLPYSGDSFSVPNNLYILGTMNTADRSIEALDTALRRRFRFEEMMPKYNLDNLSTNCEGINLQTMLKYINNALCLLLDREKQIGHAYLLDINTIDDLKKCFKNKIIPLLQEYFYGDYEKIRIILGESFVLKKRVYKEEIKISKKVKNNINTDDTNIYEIQTPAQWDFKDIYANDLDKQDKAQ